MSFDEASGTDDPTLELNPNLSFFDKFNFSYHGDHDGLLVFYNIL